MERNLSLDQHLQVGGNPVLDEWLGRLRGALDDVRPEMREDLVARAVSEIELDAGLRYIGPEDQEKLRAVLAGYGTPEAYARVLRERAGIAERPAEEPAQESLTDCRTCHREVSTMAPFCPHCGAARPGSKRFTGVGYEYKSKRTFRGWPLVHIAFGKDANGKLRVARGVLAIGQFAVGWFTIAQFGVGFVFGLGQFVIAPLCIGQFALGLAALGQFGIGLLFGAGMLKTGLLATGIQGTFDWFRHLLGK